MLSLKKCLTDLANTTANIKAKIENITTSITNLTPVWYQSTSSNISVKIGTVLIQGGYIEITPSAAETVTERTVTFYKKYSSVPMVITGLTGQPQVTTCRTTAIRRTASSFVATIFATNTTERGILWIAIGKC